MEHETYREQLSALLDGELNETDRAAVTAHLAQCADCQAYLAELTALRDAMGAWEDEDVPDGFAEGVMERVRREARPKRGQRRAWRGLAALAACAAVALLAIHSVPRMGGAATGGSAPAAAESRVADASVTAAAPAQTEPAEMTAETATEEEAPTPQTDTTADWLETQMLFLTGGTEEPAAEAAEETKLVTGNADDGAAPESANAAAELLADDDALTLAGEGAADWLAAHGEPTEDGRWRVSVEALDALPDTLTLTRIERPEDGAVLVALAETEATP